MSDNSSTSSTPSTVMASRRTPSLTSFALKILIVSIFTCLTSHLCHAKDIALPKLVNALGADTFKARQEAENSVRKRIDGNPEPVLEALLPFFWDQEDPEIKFRLEACLKYGVLEHVYAKGGGFMGVQLGSSAPIAVNGQRRECIRVLRIIDNTAAAKSNLRNDDRVISVDEQPLSPDFYLSEFIDYIYSLKPGKIIKLKVVRKEALLDVAFELGKRPEHLRQKPLDVRQQEYFYRWLVKHRTAHEKRKANEANNKPSKPN